MTKRLSERIAMQMKSDARKISGHSRAVFLSLKDEIEEAVSDGWTLKAIWAILYKEGKIKFKYGMFRRYAQQILKKSGASSSEKVLKEVNVIRNAGTARHERGKKEVVEKSLLSEIPTFKINPKPNIKDFE